MTLRYHAHVFFDLDDIPTAELIHIQVAKALPSSVKVGPLLWRPAGPLPKPMFELEYPERVMAVVEAVLDTCRGSRPVLIHPLLEDEHAAHTTYAKWLGVPMDLRLDLL